MDKKSKVKVGIFALVVAMLLLLSFYAFAETSEEEKAGLLAEKAELEQRLLKINATYAENKQFYRA